MSGETTQLILDTLAALGAAVEQLNADLKAIRDDIKGIHKGMSGMSRDINALYDHNQPRGETALNYGRPGS
jgi:uncharacterized protein (UPF0335 family)